MIENIAARSDAMELFGTSLPQSVEFEPMTHVSRFDSDGFLADFLPVLKRLLRSSLSERVDAEGDYQQLLEAAYARLDSFGSEKFIGPMVEDRIALSKAIRRVCLVHRHVCNGQPTRAWALRQKVEHNGTGIVSAVLTTPLGVFYTVSSLEDDDVTEVYGGLQGDEHLADALV